MDFPLIQRLASPFGFALVSFLAISSQWLFIYIDPGPLQKGHAYIFDALVVCQLICWCRVCYKDPGVIPSDWQSRSMVDIRTSDDAKATQRQRWCRKCQSYKPPRAHHCKTCKRCIMKMDHHCVWTANCVSHITLPHFVRFLFYAVTNTAYLESFLYTRCAIIWKQRNLPSYLGPNIYQLALLFVLVVVNSFLLFAMLLLLGRTIWGLCLNMTTIEGWEVDRHEAVLRRARVMGGYLHGPDGQRVKIEQQEFPWDVGIWTNICQGMGAWNPIAWFWPFARSPSVESGLSFEHNGIDDPSKPWPPVDPDRMAKAVPVSLNGDGFTQSMDPEAFRMRQAADRARYEDMDGEYVVRRRPFHERLEDMHQRGQNRVYEIEDDEVLDTDNEDDGDQPATRRDDDAGEEGWRNKEGERLADFGVDEEVDFYDEDEVPLAELIRRRKQAH
ncbi:zf-DHHC-domain-containing protein [Teratosphaeria nubilosa]|uniref:Palmitoyltransferase PFA4 n=1 Tax=Teratosphaeria nubilosa TaxID=161662 RepID=A0A6G1L1U9_9PEZI|nr:zf-DHHC-domain-containing protein [Teratosphaeria nubilosa]